MKRADIVAGADYAVRMRGGHAARCVVVATYPRGVNVRSMHSSFTHNRPLSAVLMPWEAWEAKERERKERDAAVQAERERHDFAAWKAVHTKLADAQIDPVCVDGAKRTITLRWEDLARLLGGPS